MKFQWFVFTAHNLFRQLNFYTKSNNKKLPQTFIRLSFLWRISNSGAFLCRETEKNRWKHLQQDPASVSSIVFLWFDVFYFGNIWLRDSGLCVILVLSSGEKETEKRQWAKWYLALCLSQTNTHKVLLQHTYTEKYTRNTHKAKSVQ